MPAVLTGIPGQTLMHPYACVCVYSVTSVVSDSLWPYGLQPARLLYPWTSPGKNTGVSCHALLQGIFPTQGLNPCLLHCRKTLFTFEPPAKAIASLFVCVLSHFSHAWLLATLWSVAHQAPLTMRFSSQEYWSGLPCLSPGDHPNPGIEPMSPASTNGFFTQCHLGSPLCIFMA